jgi:hypothetical protein
MKETKMSMMLKFARVAGVTSALAIASVTAASAQSTPQTSPSQTPPAASPTTPATPDAKPATDMNRQGAAAPTEPSKRLVGLAVTGSDGKSIGKVVAVKTSATGQVDAIHITSGGFLGIGAKTVAIPAGKFTQSERLVQVSMTSDEVAKLPEVTEDAKK